MLSGFAVGFVRAALLMLALGSPIFFIAWRQERVITTRKFAAAVAVLAFLCGSLEMSSARLVEQCIAERNPDCYDVGSAGLQAWFVGGFAFIAWLRAYQLRD